MRSSRTRACSCNIIALAASLGLTVVAEGVESDDQLAFLAAHRCDQAQGFLFSRPLPALQASDLLKTGAPLYPAARRGLRLQTPAVLVFGAERDRLVHLQQLLQRDGYHVLTASRPEDGMEMLTQHCVAAVVADEAGGSTAGYDFLRQVKAAEPQVARVMLASPDDERPSGDPMVDGTAHRRFDRYRDDPLIREEVRKIMRRNFRPPARVRVTAGRPRPVLRQRAPRKP